MTHEQKLIWKWEFNEISYCFREIFMLTWIEFIWMKSTCIRWQKKRKVKGDLFFFWFFFTSLSIKEKKNRKKIFCACYNWTSCRSDRCTFSYYLFCRISSWTYFTLMQSVYWYNCSYILKPHPPSLFRGAFFKISSRLRDMSIFNKPLAIVLIFVNSVKITQIN